MELKKRWEDMSEKAKIAYFEKEKREKEKVKKADSRKKIELEIEEKEKEKSLKNFKKTLEDLKKNSKIFDEKSEILSSEAPKIFGEKSLDFKNFPENLKKNIEKSGSGFFRMEARPIKTGERIKRGQLDGFIKSKNISEYKIRQSNGRKYTDTIIKKCRQEALATNKVETKRKQGARGLIEEALRIANTSHLQTPTPNHIAMPHGTKEDLLGLENYLEEWKKDYENRNGKPLEDDAQAFIAGVVSAPDSLDRYEQIKYLDMAMDYLKEKFGSNLVAVVVHDDEHAEDPRSHYTVDGNGRRQMGIEHTENTDKHLHFHFFVKPEMGKDFDLHPGTVAFRKAWKEFDKILGERSEQHYEILKEITREKLGPNKFQETLVKSVIRYVYQPDGTKKEDKRQVFEPEVTVKEGKWDSRRQFSSVTRVPKAQKERNVELLKERRQRANKAYRDAMVQAQNEFYLKVSVKFGLTRFGPKRKRYSPEDWKEHRKLQEAIQFGRDLTEINSAILKTTLEQANEQSKQILDQTQAKAQEIEEKAIKVADEIIKRKEEESKKTLSQQKIQYFENRKKIKQQKKIEEEQKKRIKELESIEKKAEVALKAIEESVVAFIPSKKREYEQSLKDLERIKGNLEVEQLQFEREKSQAEKGVTGKITAISGHVDELKNRLQATEKENQELLNLVRRYAPNEAARYTKDLKK